jgi:hypothetical protein
MKILHAFFMTLSLTSLVSCGFNSTEPSHVGAAGAVGGAAVGAGTGALIGSAISAGDVGASAILGGAIGLPVGAGLGYYYVATRNDRELGRLDGIIEENNVGLVKTEEELNALRREVVDQSFEAVPYEVEKSREKVEHYTGPTLGNPYRP